MNEIYAMMIAGLVLVLLTLLIINALTQGWLWAFIRVKASMGKKTLVEVMGATRSYFVLGTPAEGEMSYKDASKETKRASVNRGNFIRRWGVDCAFVDEETNGIIDFRQRFIGVQAYDSSKADRFVARMMDRQARQQTMLILVGVGITVLAAGVAAYYGYSSYELTRTIPASVEAICAQNII